MLENIGVPQKRLSEPVKKRLKAGRMLLAGRGCAEVALAVGCGAANRAHMEAAARCRWH